MDRIGPSAGELAFNSKVKYCDGKGTGTIDIQARNVNSTNGSGQR